MCLYEEDGCVFFNVVLKFLFHVRSWCVFLRLFLLWLFLLWYVFFAWVAILLKLPIEEEEEELRSLDKKPLPSKKDLIHLKSWVGKSPTKCKDTLHLNMRNIGASAFNIKTYKNENNQKVALKLYYFLKHEMNILEHSLLGEIGSCLGVGSNLLWWRNIHARFINSG